MHASNLLRFFDTRAARNEPLVLATVIATEGSTYSKSGDFVLIDGNGVICGMLSGGCLENDLAARARVVIESRSPQTARYALAAGDEDVWGMGVGCDGSMTIYLQALVPGNDYAPFDVIVATLRGGAAAELSITDPDGRQLLKHSVRPPRHLLLLGAGLDAVPLARLVDELGWRCTVFDHRPAYVGNHDFPDGCEKHCAPAEALSAQLPLEKYDAAIVMSHHLASDRSYLRQLASTGIAYIGLLGPSARKTRLLSEIGAAGAQLAQRLHGPAGLRLGGRGPQLIALAILADIQQQLDGIN